MSVVRECAGCGHPNTGDAMFCSKCGSKLPAPAATPASTSEPGAKAGESAAAPEPSAAPPDEAPSEPEVPAASGTPEPSRRPARRVAGAARTMLGMPAPGVDDAVAAARASVEAKKPEGEAPETPADAPGKHAPATKGAPPKRIPGTARTMLGMPAPDRAEIQEAVDAAKARTEAEASPTAPAGPDVAATVAGVGAPPAAPAAPDAAKPEPGEPGGPSTPAKPALDPHTNRTMLGQPAPRRPAEAPKADAAKTPRDAPAAGIDAPSDVGAGGSEARARSAVVYPSDTGEQEALTLPTRQRSRGLAMGVLAVGVAVLLVGAGALLWTLLGGGSDLRATVEQGEDGELLVIEVPGAEEGTRVRFHGTERPLSAGTARFELSADDLTLGDNELSVDVVAPDGSVETHTVGLHLEMRVRADLGPLERTPPAIDVVVEAPPGSEVTLDGEDLALDEQGRGSRTFEIDGAEANAEGVVEHVVRYRITPPEGEPAQGELSTRIPLTTMQIDRPGSELVTDRDSVEVAGAVAPGANVTVDGEAVDVEMGRFLHTLELPEVGERTVEVVARSAGRAPHVERIQIRRVEDLEEEAARFEVNEDLTYARMAQNPSTYRGQPVRFEGVVYNVQVRQGRSVLQVLVADCPEGPRACPLWVTYPTATEAELQSRVRVLGTVAGEQQFRSESGAIRTVPRVDATFVLPARGR